MAMFHRENRWDWSEPEKPADKNKGGTAGAGGGNFQEPKAPTYMRNDMAYPTYYAPSAGARYSAPSWNWNEAKPTYTSKYQSSIDQLVNDIINRKAFSYDYNEDPLYAQYKDAYTRNGEQAMNNTMAQMAARTGGLASSYAGTAAQQTYNGYMDALNDKVPELYQLAYGMYVDEGNNMRNNLAMYQGLEDTAYGQYMDRLNQWNTDRGFSYNKYVDDRDWNYNLWQDNLSRQESAARAAYNNALAAYNKRDKEVTEYNSMLDDKYRAAIDAYAPKYSSEDADQYDYGVWKKNKGYEFMGRTYSSPDALMYAVSSAGLPTSTFTNTIKSMLENGVITQAQYNELLKSRKG